MTQVIKILISVILIQSFFFGCKNSFKNRMGKTVVLRLEPSENNPRNSEGDFIKLNDGNLLFIYTHFTGGSGDDASAHLAGRISKDNGQTWSEEDILIVPNEADMNVMSVSLIRLMDGRIALFYLRKNSKVDCVPIMRTSNDEGQEWSEPKICVDETGYYVMNNDRAVQLSNGRIILPLALHNTPKINNWFSGRIICYYSDDNGSTWSKGKEIDNPKNITTQEPGIIQLSDGTLFLFCRTNVGVQYISYSNDLGVNWTELHPSNIISPLSPATIERIPRTNDLIIVWNNNYEGGQNGGRRTPYNVSVSKNEGVSWENIKTLESDPNGWYCYTAIEFIDENILLAHCAGDRKRFGGLETTQLTLISIDWLYKPAFPDPYIKYNENGLVKLYNDEPDSKIYYTLNGHIPNAATGLLYESPISIDRTTLIQFKAYGKNNEESAIKTEYVGTDIYQAPFASIDQISNNLKYKFYECEINSTDQINDRYLVDTGITKNFNFNLNTLEKNFAIIFDGYIFIRTKGKYTFYIESNDGSVFILNDYLLIDNDGAHASVEKGVTTSLMSGYHKVKLKYFQQGGTKALNIRWSGPDFSKTDIPDSVLFN